jgi:methionine synthase I (cobalamin-dependent)/5,10-methylenetetrahydrofolate reductase
MSFMEEISRRVIIADGAMGTLLYSCGVGNCFEEINLSNPQQIKDIHRAYLAAGAELIQTNTYRANYEKLVMYGLEEQVKRINAQAVRLAKEAVREYRQEMQQRQEEKGQESLQTQRYVFGTLGGLRGLPGKAIPLTEIKRSFREQLYCLLLEGVDGLLLETYYDLEELRTVLRIARQETDLPLIAQLTLHDVGLVQGGIPLHEALVELETLGADVIGLNCRLGPYHMTKSLELVPLPQRAYLSAYPNASLPSYQDGRYQFSSNAEYFEQAALDLWKQGVRLLGGCCGTTPEHIRGMCKALENRKPLTTKEVNAQPQQKWLTAHHQANPVQQEDETRPVYTQDQGAERTSIIVELDPPKNLLTQKFFSGAKALKEAGVRALTLADNSLATPRVCNKSMAVLLKQQVNMRAIVHVTCRDRNLIGLQSHLLGLSTLGLEDVLAVTGDPAKVGDFPGASSVYDLTSFELIQLIKQCNEGLSFSGKSLGRKTNFTVAAAFNPNVRHLDQAVKRLEKKLACGTDYFLTQPVYSAKGIEELYRQTKHITVPIYLGIMPLTSFRNAEFLHHEVPGIKLPQDVRRAMEKHDGSPERAQREGLAIAKALIDTALEYFQHIYLITPFMRYDLTVSLTTYIREKQSVVTQRKQLG